VTSLIDLNRGCAVITGAGSGIGEALAVVAAEEHRMPVAVIDVSRDRAEATAARIGGAGGRAIAIAADVSDADAMMRVADQVARELGPVTFLAANAGIEHSGLMWTIPPEHWRRVQDVNVHGVFATVRAFVPGMIDSGLRSHVLCTASIGALGHRPSMSAYIVSKHAVLALGENLAIDLESADTNVGVSVLLPGVVETRIAKDALVSPTAEAEERRAALEERLDSQGASPISVAQRAFAGISAGERLIHTHQDAARVAVEHRTNELIDSVRPRP